MTPKSRIFTQAIFITIRKVISIVILVAFLGTSIQAPVYAQMVVESQIPWMPKPGARIGLSPEFTPAHLKGMVIHADNGMQFDFIIHRGDESFTDTQKKDEYQKLIKYFLASLAVPDENQWVNLSPYEKDRIIKDDFGKTEMGRDLLAQDYILKQITASLIYPESNLGQKFWDKVYTQAHDQFGTTNIPVDTFNKVWIVPAEADIYEHDNTVYILKSHLKVMLEQDYLSLDKHAGITSFPSDQNKDVNQLGSRIVKEVILPALEKEINEGKNFAMLRQVFSGMILATWYKRTLKESLLGKIYADQSKVKGIDQNPSNNEAIYQQYLKAYKKGVFNFIKEDVDKYSSEVIPRKYFSGGFAPLNLKLNKHEKLNDVETRAMVSELERTDDEVNGNFGEYGSRAMTSTKSFKTASMEDAKLGPWERFMQTLTASSVITMLVGGELKRVSSQSFGAIKKALQTGTLDYDGRKLIAHGQIPDGIIFTNAAMTAQQPATRKFETPDEAIAALKTAFAKNKISTEVTIMDSSFYGLEIALQHMIDEEQDKSFSEINFDKMIALNDLINKIPLTPAKINLSEMFPKEINKEIQRVANDSRRRAAVDFLLNIFQKRYGFSLAEANAKKKLFFFRVIGTRRALQQDESFWNNLDAWANSKNLDKPDVLEMERIESPFMKDFNKANGVLASFGGGVKRFKHFIGSSFLGEHLGLRHWKDAAQATVNSQLKPEEYGGIDLNSANLNMQIKRDGKGIPLPIAQQDLQHLNIEGLIPVIMEIKPAAALPIFSELRNSTQSTSAA